MLKKIEFYWNEDGEKVDISNDKIYWDGKQFRHKFNCCECNEPLGCICYETLESAIKGVDEGLVCTTCGINTTLNNLWISDIVDLFSYDEERVMKYEEFFSNLISTDEINAYMKECEIDNAKDVDEMEVIEGTDKEDKLREYAISLLTYDEKWDIWVDACDCYAEGESCEL